MHQAFLYYGTFDVPSPENNVHARISSFASPLHIDQTSDAAQADSKISIVNNMTSYLTPRTLTTQANKRHQTSQISEWSTPLVIPKTEPSLIERLELIRKSLAVRKVQKPKSPPPPLNKRFTPTHTLYVGPDEPKRSTERTSHVTPCHERNNPCPPLHSHSHSKRS